MLSQNTQLFCGFGAFLFLFYFVCVAISLIDVFQKLWFWLSVDVKFLDHLRMLGTLPE